ncbi:hypothetical protein PV10_04707 [Exophiala mesophila]|uniref:Indole-diterpene biosynthesis protein PaxU n=1 Tax=Exophiala mesophila TaxID=212818 RepID=A0A0D1XZ55_EXOME|nr:uncharacterized protein PV10_04707 [Exophiala mesophila]KIV93496.1 hypothetical protein PV10_04707 [Exophiala mesophila]
METTQHSLQRHKLPPDPYLDEFERINEQVYFYTPDKSDAGSESSDPAHQPDLLFICSWMYASSRNVKKYISGYKELFPNTPILLHKQDGSDIFWNSFATQRKNVQPVLKLVKTMVEKKSPAKLRVLTHLFSNGGSYTASFLTNNYLRETGDLFPVSALILDSTPSLPNLNLSHEAVSETLPKSGVVRILGSGAIWTYLVVSELIRAALGYENFNYWIRRKLNDPKGPFTQGTIKRLYIYSQADRLVPAADVEAHAKEAINVIGKDRVQTEDFGSSRHVGHVIADPERYWKIIHDLWRETVNEQ